MSKEVRTTSSSGGQKGVKPERAELIPGDVLLDFSRIYGFGAEKYEAHNWRRGYEWSKSIGAALRHLEQFNAGEDFNEEDFPGENIKHVLQCAWHCFALAWFMEHKREFDDRAIRSDEKNAQKDPDDHIAEPAWLEEVPPGTPGVWSPRLYPDIWYRWDSDGWSYRFTDSSTAPYRGWSKSISTHQTLRSRGGWNRVPGS